MEEKTSRRQKDHMIMFLANICFLAPDMFLPYCLNFVIELTVVISRSRMPSRFCRIPLPIRR